MPFGLTNARATFQVYIDDCLRPYINDFAVCYLDEILIYSTNEKEHNDHLQKVLDRLRQFGLDCQGAKCQFGGTKISYFVFIIRADEVSMESDLISTIQD